MARDDDDTRKRYREREREREEDQGSTDGSKGIAGPANTSPDAIMEKIAQADLMIDQLHNLYQMYMSGVEYVPPYDRQKLLEKMISDLQAQVSQTPSGRFRFNSLNSRYASYRDRWEKMIKDLENGKIRRPGKSK